jgi:hypothetical protein
MDSFPESGIQQLFDFLFPFLRMKAIVCNADDVAIARPNDVVDIPLNYRSQVRDCMTSSYHVLGVVLSRGPRS